MLFVCQTVSMFCYGFDLITNNVPRNLLENRNLKGTNYAGTSHDAGHKRINMIDAVIQDQNKKPIISRSFFSIQEASRWIDRQLMKKPFDSNTWTVMLFKADSIKPFYEEVRY